MTFVAKLQDTLQETVVAVGDVIRVHASEMRKIHDTREYSWDVEHAAVADLAQDLNHNIQLQTKELQKLDQARVRAWHDERAAAATERDGTNPNLVARSTRSQSSMEGKLRKEGQKKLQRLSRESQKPGRRLTIARAKEDVEVPVN